MATRPVPLVVDSSVVVRASLSAQADPFPGWRLLAPALLWSEVLSALHAARWRREISEQTANAALGAFRQLRLVREEPPGLADEAWRIADELGLAKTYDAEFLALARIRTCQFVTADARLYRTAHRLGFVRNPVELEGG